MSEAGTHSAGDGPQGLEAPPHLQRDSPEHYQPRPGLEVAGYELQAKLGSGGQGTVFRAVRQGRTYAVKFLSLPRGRHWALRERDVMRKLSEAGGLPLEAHGLWPEHQPLYLFLVMPYVRGLPLDVWTRVHNPDSLQTALLFRQGARQLSAVHAAGIIHRDVKGANLLVYGEERLVLVDFGVATYEGAPPVTGAFPPGAWPYLSPRVWRAWRGEESSRPCPADDLWALGVELYAQLTGRLPFLGGEGELVHAILHEEPPVPHELNPRVPRELGEVCWRMLRKRPEERYADALAVDAALGEALKQADGAWRTPLCEAWGPHTATTVRERDMWAGGDVLALHARLASYGHLLVRGKPQPLDEVSTLAASEAPPVPGSPDASPVREETSGQAVEPDAADRPQAAPVESVPLAGPQVASEADAPQAEAPPPPDSRETALPAARSQQVRQAAGLVLMLGLGAWLAVYLPPRASVSTPPLGTPRASLPPEFFPITLEPEHQEVAPLWKRPEGVGGAAPAAAATPAPVARATRSQETRVKKKTPAKAPAPPQPPKEADSLAAKVGAAVLTCTLGSGCATATPPAQPTPPHPPPAECPEGAQKTMEELGLIYPGSRGAVDIRGTESLITVRPGPVTMRLSGNYRDDYWGKLPRGTLFTGERLFGERVVHGRFTQAHTPEGHTYVVCLEMRTSPEWGWEKLEGSGQDTARIQTAGGLEPVERFGEPWRYEERKRR
ncbi:serine/threonine protein kinase [Archangium lansingense]|uniref:Serine/threonine-protein kinase n=1 Tax=Archangium lansingense TaxID=2995310 RepID=A0ABT4AJ49_9BACT|nr:serine/threonine-protein kinase [Archangium lansinium]MCY1081695.1 serine/threonine-protein kinase [Archangium lansinium]